jgi:late competence protein required for DNA uptake (superfamily II DNA/RNA helicase)
MNIRCLRCNGYMYYDRVYTHMGVLDVSVCINCGNVEDDVILFNRLIAPLKLGKTLGRK